jgi:transposase
MMLASAAGIDVGKFNLDVGIAPSGRRFRLSNDAAAIGRLASRLHQEGVQRVVLEAIGPYAWLAVRSLRQAGFEVGIVNPRRIKGFREAEGRRAKTDKLDASLIARFAMQMGEDLHSIPDERQQTLKALATRRRQIVELAAMEKTRLKQAPDELIAQSHRSLIQLLNEERKRIEAEIASHLKADQQLMRRYELLVSIPGIGPQVATTLITDLPELGIADRRGIASLAGLAPHPTQSGTAPPRNQIGGGRPCVRAALYMAGLVASRCHPQFKADYRAIRSQGKPAKVAIVAIARKLLVLANALVRNDRPYDPSYFQP